MLNKGSNLKLSESLRGTCRVIMCARIGEHMVHRVLDLQTKVCTCTGSWSCPHARRARSGNKVHSYMLDSLLVTCLTDLTACSWRVYCLQWPGLVDCCFWYYEDGSSTILDSLTIAFFPASPHFCSSVFFPCIILSVNQRMKKGMEGAGNKARWTPGFKTWTHKNFSNPAITAFVPNIRHLKSTIMHSVVAILWCSWCYFMAAPLQHPAEETPHYRPTLAPRLSRALVWCATPGCDCHWAQCGHEGGIVDRPHPPYEPLAQEH